MKTLDQTFNFTPENNPKKIERDISIEEDLDIAVTLTKMEVADFEVYDLSFIEKDAGYVMTNKGLAVYNKIVDALFDFLATTQKKNKMDALVFTGSTNSLSKNEQSSLDQAVNNFLESIGKNPNLLDGFYHEEDEASVSIEGANILISREKENFKCSIQELFPTSPSEPEDYQELRDRIPEWFGREISRYLDLLDEELLIKNFSKEIEDKKRKQRNILFKRTLSKMNMNYEEDNADKIVVYLNDNIDALRNALILKD
ncbi:hypothetical protein H6776_00925 [Candidatus Nomurabacteria bacterium]|nr:hypothetical protein [Candidatus Nomurabacteria bacterium]